MLIKQSFLFPPKNADRPLHIWLPEDYDTSGEYYPVMYFLTATTCSGMRMPPMENPGAWQVSFPSGKSP